MSTAIEAVPERFTFHLTHKGLINPVRRSDAWIVTIHDGLPNVADGIDNSPPVLRVEFAAGVKLVDVAAALSELGAKLLTEAS